MNKEELLQKWKSEHDSLFSKAKMLDKTSDDANFIKYIEIANRLFGCITELLFMEGETKTSKDMKEKSLFKIESNVNEGLVIIGVPNYVKYAFAGSTAEAIQKIDKELSNMTVTKLCKESDIIE